MKNWNDMPPEVKYMIVGNMDFETRTKLKMCSEADKSIVESTPFHIKRLSAFDNLYTNEHIVLIDDKDGERILGITANGNQLEVERGDVEEEKIITLPNNEDAFNWLDKFYASILLNDKMKVAHLGVSSMKIPEILVDQEATINVKTLSLYGNSAEETLKWLKVFKPNAVDVEINGSDVAVVEEIGLVPVVVNATKLRIEMSNDMNDDQLLNLKCKQLQLARSHSTWYSGFSEMRITSAGIRRLIEKVIANDFPIGSYWKIAGGFDFNTLLDGLNHRLVSSKVGDVRINEEKKLIVAWEPTWIEISVATLNGQHKDSFAEFKNLYQFPPNLPAIFEEMREAFAIS